MQLATLSLVDNLTTTFIYYVTVYTRRWQIFWVSFHPYFYKMRQSVYKESVASDCMTTDHVVSFFPMTHQLQYQDHGSRKRMQQSKKRQKSRFWI